MKITATMALGHVSIELTTSLMGLITLIAEVFCGVAESLHLGGYIFKDAQSSVPLALVR